MSCLPAKSCAITSGVPQGWPVTTRWRAGRSDSSSTSSTLLRSPSRSGSRSCAITRWRRTSQRRSAKKGASRSPSSTSSTWIIRRLRRRASSSTASGRASRSTRRKFESRRNGTSSSKTAVPTLEGSRRSPAISPRARKAYARASFLSIAEALRVAERAELGDVAAEEERDGPVSHDAQLPREQRKLVQVVGAGDEPADEARQADAEHIGDALVAAERRDLAEHAVTVRLRLAGEVLCEPAGLPQGVLAGRRVGVGARLIWDARAVAERPDVIVALDAQRLVHPDAATLVQREAEALKIRVRGDPGGPDERAGGDPRAVR